MKITDLRLFHNHEPVIEIFGYFHSKVINRLREVVFEEFAATQRYGLIFTNMWTFDMQSDWDYIEHVKDIFKQKNKNTEFIMLSSSLHKRFDWNAMLPKIG